MSTTLRDRLEFAHDALERLAPPEESRLDTARKHLAIAIVDSAALVASLEALVEFMDASGLSKTKPGGVGVFAYEGTEYSVVADARKSLKSAEGEA